MDAAPLFDADFLGTLEQLRVLSSRTPAGAGRGNRQGRFRGRGIEFADYRPYAQGDDFRHIDWAAYQRLDRLLLRLYDEEQSLAIHLLLDRSRSMAEHGKFDQARRIAAALCYVGLAQLDRVSLLTFADHLGPDLSAGRGRQSVAGVFDALARLKPDGATDLAGMTAELGRRAPRRGLAIVISDFLDPAGAERPLTRLSAMGHELFAVHVTSEIEQRADALAGDICLVDAETGARRTIEVTPNLAAAYRRACDAHARDLAACCGRCRGGYVRVDAAQPFARVILDTLRRGRLLE
jgi:uncharacterized protein (DUF58 family)